MPLFSQVTRGFPGAPSRSERSPNRRKQAVERNGTFSVCPCPLLRELIRAAGLAVRDAIRIKGTPYHELGLADPSLADDQLFDAMLAHPILINRPFVVTPWGVRLCLPSEDVLAILPLPPEGAVSKRRW